jgi:hypothetical protein
MIGLQAEPFQPSRVLWGQAAADINSNFAQFSAAACRKKPNLISNRSFDWIRVGCFY